FRIGRFCDREIWHAKLIQDDAFEYNLRILNKDQTVCLGAQGLTPVAISPLHCEPDAYEIFPIPDWVKGSIIYQIFPDRFYNGDPAKNQDFSEWYYADSRTPPPSGETLAANQEYYHFEPDWYNISGLKQSPWLEEGKPDWWSFYGGDIAGVAQKLDYLSDLGISVIYFNPLWEAKSNHKYDSADYRKLDPHFATTAEMREFVDMAHGKGIKIILDVAFNHTGESFWAFRDCVEKGKASDYWNWYDWHKWPLPKPLPPDFKPKEYYQCWWGIKDMPDLNFDLSRTHPAENHIRDIRDAQPNASLVDYILSSVEWWLTDIGIDGFRLDVPDEVPWWFWQIFRQKVKNLKPEAWLVGEIWQDATPWISPRYFDSVMNYAYFKSPVLEFFIHKLISKPEFILRIEEGLAVYPDHAARAMMNLLGSHDTQRIMEIARGDTSLVKQAVFFQMTCIGTPHIYYGDEIGMLGGKDPDNRRPFNWRWQEQESSVELREFYKKLIALRRQYPVFVEGEFSFVDLGSELLGYRRFDDSVQLLCIINASSDVLVYYNEQGMNPVFAHEVVTQEPSYLELPP
ncbi:MAG TPA: glycoside hydrolase family 13 protein, partial [Candidatus Cloacimonadota bacterium]|nr:glycoside hydrolase family 13 protein [Candidatus Cloacimonadota bacterium]